MSYKEIIEGLESMLLDYGRDQNARAIPCKGLTFRINHLNAAISALREREWVEIHEGLEVFDDVHFRAVEVRNNQTGQSHWDIHRGYISDDGDFCDVENGEPHGWQPEDYSHYRPDLSLPSPPMPEDK